MKSEFLKVLILATVSPFIGASVGLPASAHCHHSMHSHMHMQDSCSSFVHNLSTTHALTTNPVTASYFGAPLEEQLTLVQGRISKLDNDITESLARITRCQESQFKDQANSSKYDETILSEKQNVALDEEELSTALGQQVELKAQISQRVEQNPIEHAASSSNPGHADLN